MKSKLNFKKINIKDADLYFYYPTWKNYSDKELEHLLELVQNKNTNNIHIFKDDSRSLVYGLDNDIVVKEPLSRDKKWWLNYFGSRSRTELKSSVALIENGFKTSDGLLAIEVRKGRRLLKSYYLNKRLHGSEPEFADKDFLALIADNLNKIHHLGRLHGDSQRTNFFMVGNQCYVIDCDFKRNIWGKFGRRYEFIYLEKSYYRDLSRHYQKDFYYYIAKGYDDYLKGWKKFKDSLRGLLRGGKK